MESIKWAVSIESVVLVWAKIELLKRRHSHINPMERINFK
jgi:hypothetical protein